MDFGARCKRVKAADMIWPIDEDFLVKVLCYLPPKILIQCCCVCKGWLELIVRYCVPQITPSLPFLGCHILTNLSSSTYLVADRASMPPVEADVDAWPHAFNTRNPIVNRPTFLKHFFRSPKRLLHSCNGLVLFMHPRGDLYVLWNPNTKQFLFFGGPMDHDFVFAGLVVEPTWKLDRKQDFFKIIAFPEYGGVLKILTSSRCKWVKRKIKYNCPIDRDPFTKGQGHDYYKKLVYLHGRLFVVCRPRLLLWYIIEDRIVDDVVCDYVKLPPGRDDDNGSENGCIGSCGGHLQLAQNDEDARSVQIWVLSVDNREWTFTHCVSLEPLVEYTQPADMRTIEIAKFKLLTFDPVSDDGVIIWTPTLTFCYYYKSGKLVPLQSPDAVKDPPLDTLPFTPCMTPLAYASCGSGLVRKVAMLPDGSSAIWTVSSEEFLSTQICSLFV